MYDFYELNPQYASKKNHSQSTVSIDVNVPLYNEKFNELYNHYCSTQNTNTENALIDHLNSINYIIGLIPDEHISDPNSLTSLDISKGDPLNLLICTSKDREVYLPIFTSTAELNAWYKQPIITLTAPANWLWKFVIAESTYTGVIINPASSIWTISAQDVDGLLHNTHDILK